MAEDQHTGISLFDGVLVVGGGLIALFVAFTIFNFVVGIVWLVVKVVVIVAVIAIVARLLFRRHRS